MKNLNKVKILIVGLTTVMALSNFKSNNLKGGAISDQFSDLNPVVYQNNFTNNTI